MFCVIYLVGNGADTSSFRLLGGSKKSRSSVKEIKETDGPDIRTVIPEGLSIMPESPTTVTEIPTTSQHPMPRRNRSLLDRNAPRKGPPGLKRNMSLFDRSGIGFSMKP